MNVGLFLLGVGLRNRSLVLHTHDPEALIVPRGLRASDEDLRIVVTPVDDAVHGGRRDWFAWSSPAGLRLICVANAVGTATDIVASELRRLADVNAPL